MIKGYAAFEKGGELKPFEYELGTLGSNDVEIQVEYCGLCHSDLGMIDNEYGLTQYPLVPGHEVIGKISAIGDNVSTLSVGQTVGLGWHSSYCGTCPQCLAGDHHLCSNKEFTIGGRHGGFAEKVRAKENSVVAIPDDIDLESAGPMFCAGITVFNPLVQYDIKPTSKVAVIGIGGLGHLALQFLNAWGCEVTAFTSSERKKKEALELGAHKTLNSRDKEEIAAAAGRFDFILSTVAVKLDWDLYLSTLAPKGKLHFVGVSLEPLDINPFTGLVLNQTSVSGSSVGSPSTIKTMLEFAGLHKVAPLIETFPMSQINDAIEKLKSGNVHYRIVLKNDF